jgi:hypothetical protein
LAGNRAGVLAGKCAEGFAGHIGLPIGETTDPPGPVPAGATYLGGGIAAAAIRDDDPNQHGERSLFRSGGVGNS